LSTVGRIFSATCEVIRVSMNRDHIRDVQTPGPNGGPTSFIEIFGPRHQVRLHSHAD
jgi:hypothetical protein